MYLIVGNFYVMDISDNLVSFCNRQIPCCGSSSFGQTENKYPIWCHLDCYIWCNYFIGVFMWFNQSWFNDSLCVSCFRKKCHCFCFFFKLLSFVRYFATLWYIYIFLFTSNWNRKIFVLDVNRIDSGEINLNTPRARNSL